MHSVDQVAHQTCHQYEYISLGLLGGNHCYICLSFIHIFLNFLLINSLLFLIFKFFLRYRVQIHLFLKNIVASLQRVLLHAWLLDELVPLLCIVYTFTKLLALANWCEFNFPAVFCILICSVWFSEAVVAAITAGLTHLDNLFKLLILQVHVVLVAPVLRVITYTLAFFFFLVDKA